ncbi:MAG: RagB/SusD family nutrient uptake outer membrane protein [Prevotellaceae bacterium]|nr:RagB/SusD family nutrient uptake outer membrane protein [Prevotellaceae bacterium]
MNSKIFKQLLVAGAVVVLGGGMTSCEDYLTLYPTTSITEEEFWNTRNDVNNVRASAYYQLTQCTGKILAWGEFRSDNVELSDMSKANYRYMQEAVLQPSENLYDWSAFYKGINFCNKVLEHGQQMVDKGTDPSFTNIEWQPMKAEMVSLRALYYFYLVRSFRNVPFVRHSISTDAEALVAREKAVPGQEIMDSLIHEVEAVLPTAAINYGRNSSNKGRWTRTSIHALLADMYLWRAGMVYKGREKGFPVVNEKGDTLSAAQEKSLATDLMKKTISHADYVIKEQMDEFKLNLDLNNVPQDDKRRAQTYPLIQSEASSSGIFDAGYSDVLGSSNSSESVFELQYDGVNVKNGVITEMFYGNSGSGGYKSGLMLANPSLFSKDAPVDPAKGYGRTDMRFVSYTLRNDESAKTNAVSIVKGAAKSVFITFSGTALGDITKSTGSYSMQEASSQSTNWPVYRLSDMMTLKAEAMARLGGFGLPDYPERDTYRILDELFRRNNPTADTVAASSNLFCKRLRSYKAFKADDDKDGTGWKKRYEDYGSPLKLAFNERQREFLGEGKRWYDIVRECEFRGATKDVLSDWVGLSSVVRNRLRSLWSLYNPIYLEELKVNGKEYGSKTGQLTQNPAWEKYMPKS